MSAINELCKLLSEFPDLVMIFNEIKNNNHPVKNQIGVSHQNTFLYGTEKNIVIASEKYTNVLKTISYEDFKNMLDAFKTKDIESIINFI